MKGKCLRRQAVTLLLLLLWSPCAWAATSLQWTLPGTPITFGDSGKTVTWTLSNRTAGTGQVSARYDRGAGAGPSLYELRCWISLNGTHTLGQAIEYYLSTSDGTNPDAEVGTTNTTITSDQRRALGLPYVLPVYQTTNLTTMAISWRNVYIPGQYVSLVMFNATTIPTETSTTKHGCSLTPMPFQQQ
jgi:hypothetical protein